jgi:hypothetical protein
MLKLAKENMFEIVIALGLFVSGLARLSSPAARAAEQQQLPLQRPEVEWLITGYELAGPAVIFLAPAWLRRLYLLWFFICVVGIGLYYLAQRGTDVIRDLPFTVIYTNDTKSLVIHYFVALVLTYVLFVKD